MFSPGAGRVIQIPTEDAAMDAYFVSPAAHIGRVATGIVFISEPTTHSRQENTHSLAEGKTIIEQFGLASISYADKLAEQGYKVVVVEACKLEKEQMSTEHVMQQLEQAAMFLKQQDIQRVALFGYGTGADITIKMAVEQRCLEFDCFVAMSPDGNAPWTRRNETSSLLPPLLLLAGDQTLYVRSDAFSALQDAYAQNIAAQQDHHHQPLTFKSRVLVNQQKGFAFCGITDEDAATQAIAEVLDWLGMHLHRFRLAACTSDTDPWWPQGLNGPFHNIGLQKWQETRQTWTTSTQPRPIRRSPVSSDLIFDGLSSLRRTFDLPQPMALADLVDILVEIWEVQE